MEIAITYTPQLGAHIMAERVWHTSTRSIQYYAQIACMLLLAAGIFSIKPAAMTELLMIVLGGFGLFMLFDGPIMAYALYRWKTLPQLQIARTCVFSAEGVAITAGEEKTQIRWQECPAYRDKNDSFTIYTSRKGGYLTIPKSVLVPQELGQLQAWLEEKVQKIGKV